jgi:hypothetical protein
MGFRIRAAIALAAALFGTGSPAQEGFPLDGTWRGSFGPDDKRTTVVIVMKWDGENIDGIINPGPSSVPFASASLEPSDWTVHIEAQSRDGEPIVVDALLENIGSYNRTLTGTWTQSGVEHALKITRE